MKKHAFLLLFFLPLALCNFAKSPTKRALIVAVGEYPKDTNWRSLHSANDVELIRAALLKQGFLPENIHVVKDEAATKSGVNQAFQNHLIERVRSGDIAFFHFSGHGQQVADDNGDELDNYDEALVPYDSPQRFQAGVYEGERLLRDDELGRWLFQLRRQLGPKGQVLLSLDACHSGTATRGYASARGSATKMAPVDYQRLRKERPIKDNLLSDEMTAAKKLAPMVVISASSANELNYEYRTSKSEAYGSLSYAFYKAFSSLTPQSSYRGLFNQIKKEMTAIAPRQTPQAEGDLNLLVLGGAAKPPPPHFTIERALSKRALYLDAGSLAGIHPGTRIKLYPIDTREPNKTAPLALGTIVGTFPLISEVMLDEELDEEKSQGAWVFVESKNYGDVRLKLRVDLNESDFKTKLLNEIAEYQTIQIDHTYPDLIIDQEADLSVALRTKEDYLLLKKTIPPEQMEILTEEIIRRMLTYAQAEFLRGLEMENRFLKVEMELAPVSVKVVDGRPVVDQRLSLQTKIGADGIMRFREAESFILRVTNKGVKPVYFSVLDIWADNQIYQLIPNQDCSYETGDYFIKPGETKELSKCIIDLYPPYGNEMLKLIATEQPLNLQKIIDARGASEDSPNNPFAALFQATFKGRADRAPTPSIPPSAAHIYSVVFKITP